MKIMNKLFATLVLFGMSSAAFAYDFTFNNKTDKPVHVMIKIGLMSAVGFLEKTVQPNEKATISPEGQYKGYCLQSIYLNKKQTAFSFTDEAKQSQVMSNCNNAMFEITEEAGILALAAK